MNDAAVVPSRAFQGDAGYDLRSCEEVLLIPGQRAVLPTGIAIAIPEGYAGMVLPRSGLAARHGISVVNGPGLIDSKYRGEIKVVLVNLDPLESHRITVGDKVAQLVIQRVETPVFRVVDELDGTDRGTGGFGSSGSR